MKEFFDYFKEKFWNSDIRMDVPTFLLLGAGFAIVGAALATRPLWGLFLLVLYMSALLVVALIKD